MPRIILLLTSCFLTYLSKFAQGFEHQFILYPETLKTKPNYRYSLMPPVNPASVLDVGILAELNSPLSNPAFLDTVLNQKEGRGKDRELFLGGEKGGGENGGDREAEKGRVEAKTQRSNYLIYWLRARTKSIHSDFVSPNLRVGSKSFNSS